MDLVLSKEAINSIISIIDEDLLRAGADCVLLVDRSGNLIVNRGDPANLDVVALAALSAANFGATAEIAKLIGEDDFTLLFHKGKNENIHFTKVGKGFILLTLFGKDVSLGVIRLKTAKVTEDLLPVLAGEQ
ncbi:MAG TPA: roadblock/LC7 domain-containing protein [Syntrophobacteria bacterium]|nr:roadblock/LC7 domain-containing protein [Syntrophobacteria bacterium]